MMDWQRVTATDNEGTKPSSLKAILEYKYEIKTDKVAIYLRGGAEVDYGWSFNGIYHSLGYYNASGNSISLDNGDGYSISQDGGTEDYYWVGGETGVSKGDIPRQNTDYTIVLYSYWRKTSLYWDSIGGYVNMGPEAQYRLTIPALATPPTIKYKVMYNLMGGTYTNNTTFGTVEVSSGGSITTPNVVPTKKGFTFNGWSDGNNHTYQKNTTISSITSNLILSAQWSAKTMNTSSKYITKTSFYNFMNNIKEQLHPINLTSSTDYVIDVGASGYWTWRKWKSGLVECWGRIPKAEAIYYQWNNLYITDESQENFPSGVFTNTPKYCNIDWASNGVWSMAVSLGGGLSSTTTQQYCITRPGSAGNVDATGILLIYAIGQN